MRNILQAIVDSAAVHADYADVRHIRTRSESIHTRNGGVARAAADQSEGIGIRVRIGGAWGFAATRESSRDAAESALERAIAVARAQPAAPATDLVPVEPARGEHRAPEAGTDPFTVPLEQKLDILMAADAAMAAEPAVRLRTGQFHAQVETRTFASTEGAFCEQTLTECGGGIAATAVEGDESQLRSYPSGHAGDVAQAGWEHFAGLDLPGNAGPLAEEAAALLHAPACPALDSATLIVDSEQLAIQLHESVGHAVELDRVLGWEASYAGTSWVTPDDLGSLRYGSELMNVIADATVPGGLGSYAWDDEGAPGAATPIVIDGVLRGFLSSRETAALVGLDRSGACCRASGFDRQPIVRMTNVSISPGDAGSLDDLIADTDDGILMQTNRSWSIDQRRWQFQFATEVAWEIRNGERGRMLRNPSYAGVTPEFWSGLDAVCAAPAGRLHGLLNCGKGEPGQLAHVSHGAAPARFRGVRVGVA
jgi:TldD protein